MTHEEKPRTGRNSDANGSYEQSIKLITPVINQGDVVELEHYFTGYGIIGASKLAFYPSSEIFDRDSSYIINGIKEENGQIMNGADKHPFKDVGVIINMQGVFKSGWSYPTQFFDVTGGDVPQIYTEKK